MRAYDANSVMQGHTFDFNFIHGNTEKAIFFDGSGLDPGVNNNIFKIDALEGSGITPYGVYSNYGSLNVNKFMFDAFLAGFVAGGILLTGNGNFISFNASPAAAEINALCDVAGVGNKIVNLGGGSSYIGSPISAVTTSNNLAGFNSGYKLISNNNIIRLTLGETLTAGSTKIFYIFNSLLDRSSNYITVQPYNGNKACVFTAIQDESYTAGVDGNTVKHQILLRLYAIENMAAGNYDFLVKVGY
jgi:hypothetical protein